METGVRPLPEMDYASPTSLKEALELLKKYKRQKRKFSVIIVSIFRKKI